jgi:threonine/homoserine/homoserine lactone efflux protein
VEALLVGLSLGAAAGISPGPLLVLVVTSALRAGWPAGVLAAAAPLVSDVLVVTGTLVVLDRLPEATLGYVACAGALFVGWSGVATLRESRTATLAPGLVDQRAAARRALGEAALVNLLSPHPWIFWATVLGPLLLTSWRDGPVGAVAMVVGFYVTLVGAKAVVAVLVARGRHRIGDRGYRRALLAAGFLLLLAAVLLAVEFVPVAFS